MEKCWTSSPSALNPHPIPVSFGSCMPLYSMGKSLPLPHFVVAHTARSKHLRDAIDRHLGGLQDAGGEHGDQVEQHIRLLLEQLWQGALEGLRGAG